MPPKRKNPLSEEVKEQLENNLSIQGRTIPQSLYTTLCLLSSLQPELKTLIIQEICLYVQIKQQFTLHCLFPQTAPSGPNSTTSLTPPPTELLPYPYLAQQYQITSLDKLVERFPYYFYDRLRDRIISHFQAQTQSYPGEMPQITKWLHLQQWVWANNYITNPQIDVPSTRFKVFVATLLSLSPEALQPLLTLFPTQNYLHSHAFFKLPTFSAVFTPLFLSTYKQNNWSKFKKGEKSDDNVSTRPQSQKNHSSSRFHHSLPTHSDKNSTFLLSSSSLQNDLEFAAFHGPGYLPILYEQINAQNSQSVQNTADIRTAMKESLANINVNPKTTRSQSKTTLQRSAVNIMRRSFYQCLEKFETAVLILCSKIAEIISVWYDNVYTHELLELLEASYLSSNVNGGGRINANELSGEELKKQYELIPWGKVQNLHKNGLLLLNKTLPTDLFNPVLSTQGRVQRTKLEMLYENYGSIDLARDLEGEAVDVQLPIDRFYQTDQNLAKTANEKNNQNGDNYFENDENDEDDENDFFFERNLNENILLDSHTLQHRWDINPQTSFDIDGLHYSATIIESTQGLLNHCTCKSLWKHNFKNVQNFETIKKMAKNNKAINTTIEQDLDYEPDSDGDFFDNYCDDAIFDEIELYSLTGVLPPELIPSESKFQNSQKTYDSFQPNFEDPNPSNTPSTPSTPNPPNIQDQIFTQTRLKYYSPFPVYPMLIEERSFAATYLTQQLNANSTATTTDATKQALFLQNEKNITFETFSWLRQRLQYVSHPQLLSLYYRLYSSFITKENVMVLKSFEAKDPTKKTISKMVKELQTNVHLPPDSLLLTPPTQYDSPDIVPLFQYNYFKPELTLFHNNIFLSEIIQPYFGELNRKHFHNNSFTQQSKFSSLSKNSFFPLQSYQSTATKAMSDKVNILDNQLSKFYQLAFTVPYLHALPVDFKSEHRSQLENIKKHASLTATKTSQFSYLTGVDTNGFKTGAMVIRDKNGNEVEKYEQIYPPELPPQSQFDLLDMIKLNQHVPELHQEKENQINYCKMLLRLMALAGENNGNESKTNINPISNLYNSFSDISNKTSFVIYQAYVNNHFGPLSASNIFIGLRSTLSLHIHNFRSSKQALLETNSSACERFLGFHRPVRAFQGVFRVGTGIFGVQMITAKTLPPGRKMASIRVIEGGTNTSTANQEKQPMQMARKAPAQKNVNKVLKNEKKNPEKNLPVQNEKQTPQHRNEWDELFTDENDDIDVSVVEVVDVEAPVRSSATSGSDLQTANIDDDIPEDTIVDIPIAPTRAKRQKIQSDKSADLNEFVQLESKNISILPKAKKEKVGRVEKVGIESVSTKNVGREIRNEPKTVTNPKPSPSKIYESSNSTKPIKNITPIVSKEDLTVVDEITTNQVNHVVDDRNGGNRDIGDDDDDDDDMTSIDDNSDDDHNNHHDEPNLEDLFEKNIGEHVKKILKPPPAGLPSSSRPIQTAKFKQDEDLALFHAGVDEQHQEVDVNFEGFGLKKLPPKSKLTLRMEKSEKLKKMRKENNVDNFDEEKENNNLATSSDEDYTFDAIEITPTSIETTGPKSTRNKKPIKIPIISSPEIKPKKVDKSLPVKTPKVTKTAKSTLKQETVPKRDANLSDKNASETSTDNGKNTTLNPNERPTNQVNIRTTRGTARR